MNSKQIRKGIFFALSLFALTFFFLKTRGADLKQHHRIGDALKALKQEETDLNRNVLKLRFGLIENYDVLPKHIQRMQKPLDEIKGSLLHMPRAEREKLDLEIESYRKMIKEKEGILEEFSAENATLNNSLRYFPVLVRQSLERLEKEPEANSLFFQLNQLLQSVLTYELLKDPDLEREIIALMKSLAVNPQHGLLKDSLPALIKHAEFILKGTMAVDAIILNLDASPSLRIIHEIEKVYALGFESSVKESNRYRLALYVLCLSLFAYASFIFFRLRFTSAALRQVNETLEARVQERTAELSKVNKVLLQSEKMSAVGQLAAGVAHEINNPLGVILGFSQGMLKRIQAGDPLELPLKSIEREAVRCKNLVQDLLTFSRVGKGEKELVDLTESIEVALSLVMAQSKVKNTDLVKEFSEVPKITGNKNQIQQIIVNLSNNAMDAMPKGGRLVIRLRKAKLDDKDAVEIQVQDTGQGIAPEIRDNIFNPFFTTKEIGKGTGLGLSLVFEIVQKHNGRILLESEMGKGTTFQVFLPVMQ